MTTLMEITGRAVTNQLGAGSEGSVYKLDGGLALKIGNRPIHTKVEADLASILANSHVIHSIARNNSGIRDDNVAFEIGDHWGYLMPLQETDFASRFTTMVRNNQELNIILTVMRDVFIALDYIHELGIVHSDVKPSNILIGRNNSGVQGFLADFGASYVLPEGIAFDLLSPNSQSFYLSRIRDTNKVCGTPLYMAPEQVVAGRASIERDIYSAYAVLYQALTGKSINPTEDILTKISRIGQSDIDFKIENVSLPDIEPEIVGDLKKLLASGLKVDPHLRINPYKSAVEISTILEKMDSSPGYHTTDHISGLNFPLI